MPSVSCDTALLGLIESTNAGTSWTPISLYGETDLHVLGTTGDHVYGYDATSDRLLVSNDRGKTWEEDGYQGRLSISFATRYAGASSQRERG